MMQPPQYLTTQIVTALADLVRERGLRLDKLDEPISAGYTEQWIVRDGEDWNYAGFGIVGQGYRYCLANLDVLPFEARETIDWLESEIVRLFAESK
jgi:hypothetical protein